MTTTFSGAPGGEGHRVGDDDLPRTARFPSVLESVPPGEEPMVSPRRIDACRALRRETVCAAARSVPAVSMMSSTITAVFPPNRRRSRSRSRRPAERGPVLRHERQVGADHLPRNLWFSFTRPTSGDNDPRDRRARARQSTAPAANERRHVVDGLGEESLHLIGNGGSTVTTRSGAGGLEQMCNQPRADRAFA